MEEIIYKNPFKESFYMKSDNVWSEETVHLVHCKNCNQFSRAFIRVFREKHKYYCSICKKRTNRKYERATYISPIYAKVFDDEHKITYSCAFYHHLLKFDFEKKKMRKMSVVYRYNITHNKQTKQTYLIRKSQNPKKNRIANITFGACSFTWKLLAEHLQYIEQTEAYQSLLQTILPTWFSEYAKLSVMHFPILLRYPQLMLLPMELTEYSHFRFQLRDNKQKRAQLPQLPYKQAELMKWLVDKKLAKKEQKILFKNPHLLVMYKHLVHLVDNADAKQYILEKLAGIPDLKRFDFHYLPIEHLFGQLNPNYLHEFERIKRHFRSEKMFAKAIVKQMETSKDYIFEYMRDIVRMMEVIKEEMPTYEVPKLYDLEMLHDVLASDMNKLEYEYEEISYVRKERLKLETETKDYRLLLAASNHQLIEVGTNLHICVGSYAQEAIEKLLYIVLLENKKTGEVTHCLELHCQRSKWYLVQAKGKYNHVPSEEISSLLIEYCRERNIQITTQDIDLESVLEMTS
ncbi:PcfJ domain-containing protein [Bacillus toyonensis]|uniref:PcfJ domain-containing protein n=1 Tax=Bacillus toyonensis TaxID=155322 RepID=UPI001C0DBF98|nr:PcfJ domain-containing protein [Bacillus toyonensis]MBU4642901.1 PcfJ domain-containing protein [Bacillus toyonensis]